MTGAKSFRAAVVGCGAIAPNHVTGILAMYASAKENCTMKPTEDTL